MKNSLVSYQEKAKMLLPVEFLFIRGTFEPDLFGKLYKNKKKNLVNNTISANRVIYTVRAKISRELSALELIIFCSNIP
jgi:hypothetical protein